LVKNRNFFVWKINQKKPLLIYKIYIQKFHLYIIIHKFTGCKPGLSLTHKSTNCSVQVCHFSQIYRLCCTCQGQRDTCVTPVVCRLLPRYNVHWWLPKHSCARYIIFCLFAGAVWSSTCSFFIQRHLQVAAIASIYPLL